jgi:hypothetical protein
MKNIIINIAKEFSKTPGSRYISQGRYTGQKFRKEQLEPLFIDEDDNRKITIILDGAYGYPTSFTEEAFGGLARQYGKDRVKKRLEFISEEEPLLIEEINSYIEKADNE